MAPFGFRNFDRAQILQFLFPVALLWSLIVLFSEEIERLAWMNPFPENSTEHQALESALPLLAMSLLGASSIGLKYLQHRIWPKLLCLPIGVSYGTTLLHIVAHSTLLFIPIVLSVVVLSYQFYDPSKDPQGQFHIWVWGGGIYYAIAFTPLLTILSVWLLLRRRGKAKQ